MPDPTVSIVILNYQHPEIINICLRSLEMTDGVEYETIVVDNGSDPHVVDALRQHKAEGRITTLVESPINTWFSEGNNIGFRNSNPNSEYVLLLNSDVGIVAPNWLTKMLDWMNGTIDYKPSVWDLHTVTPSPGPKDIISFGWSFDPQVIPSSCRPEGWCCMFRRNVFQEMSPDFPFYYGFEEMIGNVVRAGARCGVLWHYQPYLVHREGGSEGSKIAHQIVNTRTPDIPGWFNGINIETLDFSLGPHEHDSYLDW